MYKPGQWKMVCSACQIEKDCSEFYKRSETLYRKQCKDCYLAKIYANPKRAEYNQRAVEKYREANREKCLDRSKEWRKKNLKYDAFRSMTYRQRRRKACPPWVDLESIKEIYLKCPDGFHVDHIVPLKGRLVSGLHVPANLQYLPATENLRKRNNYAL